MSESKLISPLLDGFSMGNPVSEHDGIRCCPAIKENTDKKYIVKIISIPASQSQMDALLLAGAYRDPADAMEYFREIGEGIMKEAELLKKLSKLDGFLPYEGWQMEPITKHRLGYEVYLVSSYKRSLDKYIRRNPVTHLEAVNLGLDLCTALSVCREAGAMYVDLKPSNIFLSDKKEYRIGDLGFIELDAMSYTALPKKYLSSYTPPELYDPMAVLNLTIDTYAVGMILYQLYNEGRLPFKGQAPAEVLPSPVNADYELAEIIMKAIHPDPEQRWTDPKDMGKELASYMQKNVVNDVPITPYTPLDNAKPRKKKKKLPQEEIPADASFEPAPETVAETSTPKITEASTTEVTAAQDSATDSPVSAESETIVSVAPTEPEDAVTGKDTSEEDTSVPILDEIVSSDVIDPVEVLPKTSEETTETVAEEVVEESPADSIEPDVEEALPEMSEELSRIIAKADDLIAHETPEGVVVPELPEEPDPFAFILEDSDEIDDSDIPVDPLMEEPEEDRNSKKKKNGKKFENPNRKKRIKKFFSALLALAILVLIALAGFWFYQNMYLQTIHGITIDGDKNQLTVSVDTNAEESLLTISCSDNYGNVTTQPLTNGQAAFTDLSPNTLYQIQLEIEGFHALVGKTSDVFTTDATTNIVSFTSVAGAEDGSVMLNFTVDGEEPTDWAVVYSAEGEETLRKTFSGHSVTISNLSLGKLYTFTLDAGDVLSLSGQKSLELMASRLILAEDLLVTSASGSDITVQWKAPGDIVVDSWDVRCYSENGYDEQMTVTENQALFNGIDPASSYTIEVTAAGMTQPARTNITANPVNIQNIDARIDSYEKMDITWEYTGDTPEGGWLLMYTIDGSDSKNVVKCTKASAAVSPVIPGAKYQFIVHAADSTTVFNNTTSFTCPEAARFDANGLSADKLTVNLLKTPEEANWYYENISDELLTDNFTSGDGISIVLRSSDSFYLPGSQTDILYVMRDSYGNVLPDYTTEATIIWKEIWSGGDVKNGELDVPKVPTAPGEYTLDLFFDGAAVAQLNFTIAE